MLIVSCGNGNVILILMVMGIILRLGRNFRIEYFMLRRTVINCFINLDHKSQSFNFAC